MVAIREICEAPATHPPRPRRLIVGIGDDAAVWQPSRSHRSIITTDALVDGVHFVSSKMAAQDVGYRAMAASLSDCAAMGARPVLATVALGVAPGTTQEWILEAYRGMASVATAYGASIAGGDFVRAPALTVSITLVGEVAQQRLKRRDGGRAGDVVAVTGKLGASRAGLELLQSNLEVDVESRSAALAAFGRPVPRVREGRWLGASTSVHAMMDCSDGLALDLSRLARASGCGAVIQDVPVHPAAVAVAAASGADATEWATSAGEDFELLVAVAPRAFAHVARAFRAHFQRELERIGILISDPGLYGENASGARSELRAHGWDHLTSN